MQERWHHPYHRSLEGLEYTCHAQRTAGEHDGIVNCSSLLFWNAAFVCRISGLPFIN